MEDNKHYIKVTRHKWPDEIEAEKKRTKKRFIVLISCVLCFGLGLSTSTLANKTTGSKDNPSNSVQSEKLNAIYEVMQNKWYFGKDIEDLDTFLIDNAIRGLTTNEYDLHTNYLNKEQAEPFMSKLEGSIIGVGIRYMKINDEHVITDVILDSPAEKAGLQRGDILSKVDGIALKGKSSDEIVSFITGEEGSAVQLEYIRNGETNHVEMIRKKIEATVSSRIRDGVGILEISSVSENTAEAVGKHLKELEKQDVNNLIIDLRNNTGGYVKVMCDIAGYFIGDDKIVMYEEHRDGSINEYKSTKQEVYEYDNVYILTNDRTASAAEGLAACLRYHMNAKLIGVTTYGKGTVQIPMVFKDGSYFKYTIAEWSTPAKEKINLKGIKPDVVIEQPKALQYTKIVDDSQDYKVDSVGEAVKEAQIFLEFLGYDVDRVDGYFSVKTQESVKKFQEDNQMKIDGMISENLRTKLISLAVQEYSLNKDKYDNQLNKAIELIRGK